MNQANTKKYGQSLMTSQGETRDKWGSKKSLHCYLYLK